MRHERRRVLRRTKIVCTLGPATGTVEMIEQLVRTGMDCARINFSHGSLDEHRETIGRIREVRASSGRPVAILADLQGPKLRVGPLPTPIELVKGEEIVLAGLGSAEPGDLELGFEVDFSKHVRRGTARADQRRARAPARARRERRSAAAASSRWPAP